MRSALAPSARRLAGDDAPAASTVGFVVVLIGGLVIRLVALGTGLGFQNSDQSIVYLMARHVEHGDFRVFFWGQQYGGTILQLTAGALFWLVGPSFVGLQVVEIGFWLVACLLLRAIVANASGVLSGNVAGALLWFASPYMVSFSFGDPGFYAPATVLGLLAVLTAQRLHERPTLAAAAMGLCLGLAVWTTPLAVALVLPSAVWLSVRLRSVRSLLIGAGCAVVGAVPWLWANVHTGFASLQPQNSGEHVGLASGYWRVFTDLVPAIMGAVPDSSRGRAVAVFFVLLILVGLALGLRRRNTTIVVLCVSALLVPAVIAFSGVQVVPAAGRYATLMVAAAAAVVAWGLSRHPAVAMLAVAAVCVWTVTTVDDYTHGFRAAQVSTFGSDVKALGSYLERNGRTAVWADYWIAYLLSAATNERVTAAAIAPPIYRREPSYEVAAMRPRQTTVVVFAGKDNDQTLHRQLGLPRHRRAVVGPYAVWLFNGRVDVPNYLVALPPP